MQQRFIYILFLFLLFVATGYAQPRYVIAEQPLCWNTGSVDSSITRYLLITSQGALDSVMVLDQYGNTVNISTGTITFGHCDCCGGSGSGIDINIYTSSGTLTANRFLSGDSLYSLTFHNLDSFLIRQGKLILANPQNEIKYTTFDGYQGQVLGYDATGDSTYWTRTIDTIFTRNDSLFVVIPSDTIIVPNVGGSSGVNIYNTSDTITDPVRVVEMDSNRIDFVQNVPPPPSGNPYYILRLVAATSSDDDQAIRIISLVGTNGDSLQMYGLGNRWVFNTKNYLRMRAAWLEMYSDSARIDMNSSYNRFTDSHAAPAGLEYAADYSSTYSNRSLIDKGYFLANQYWTKTGTRVFPTTLTDNVGIGVDPSTTARLVTRGSGTTSSTVTSLFEASDGRDILELRDDGRVLVAAPSGVGFLQIAQSVSVSANLYFGASSGTGGLLSHGSGVFTLGSASSPSLFRFTHQTTYPTLTVGGATSTVNGIFRARGGSAFVIGTTPFYSYQGGVVSYGADNGSNTVGTFVGNNEFTISAGGATTGVFAQVLDIPNFSIGAMDTTVMKPKLRGYYAKPAITLPTKLPDGEPYVEVDFDFTSLSLAGTPIIGLRNNVTDATTGNYSLNLSGNAPAWIRGRTAIGENSTTANSNTKLEIDTRTATGQLTGRGTAPGIAINTTNAGTGATASIVSAESSDVAGRFTFTTGTGTLLTGTWITITFAGNAFSQIPIVHIQSDATKDTQAGLDASTIKNSLTVIASTTNFIIYADATLLGALTETRFDFSYIIIGGNQ